MDDLAIEYLPTADLIPYARNARTHDDKQVKQIAASIKEFGFNNPILISDDKTIIAGHGRVLAAEKLELSSVPCVYLAHLNENQRKAYTLIDNQLTLNSTWDEDILKLEIASMKEEIDLSLLGFEDDELARLLAEENHSGNEGLTDPDDIPEVTEPIAKRGQIWKLGEHRVMCGDSTSKDDVERLMDGEKADMVFTDPPYGISYDDETKTKWDSEQTRTSKAKANNFGQIANDDIHVEIFVEKILEFFGYAKRVFIWGVLNGNGNIPKGSFIVWDKKNEAQAKCPFGDFDICWSKNVGWKMLRHIWGGFVSKEKGEQRWHPTQKPVSLAVDFFDRWGSDNDIVVDLFLGSGSTLIACEKTGRRCFGMEISESYTDVIIKRWEDFTGNKAELING